MRFFTGGPKWFRIPFNIIWFLTGVVCLVCTFIGRSSVAWTIGQIATIILTAETFGILILAIVSQERRKRNIQQSSHQS